MSQRDDKHNLPQKKKLGIVGIRIAYEGAYSYRRTAVVMITAHHLMYFAFHNLYSVLVLTVSLLVTVLSRVLLGADSCQIPDSVLMALEDLYGLSKAYGSHYPRCVIRTCWATIAGFRRCCAKYVVAPNNVRLT